MSEENTYLSQILPHPKTYDVCQACGGKAEETWQETNDHGTPILIFVRLCKPCVEKVLVPSPRIYRARSWGESAPGAMPICCDCKHQTDMVCGSKMRRMHGGIGLHITEQRNFGGFTKRRKPKDPTIPEFSGPPLCGAHEPRG